MKTAALAPYFGAKRTMAPLIVQQLGPHKAYAEPFAGSMAVLLAKQPCSFEIANDLNGDIINLAYTVQHDCEGPHLYRELRRTLYNQALFGFAKERIGLLPQAECRRSIHDVL